ncbi:MAG: Lrp/AsnC ligand binding domain-containing protein [Lentisphaeria bacterium]|nr:Lrp/AsnC ligand binding domain-containing protein [Lentisphaeria bacterium]
MVTAIILVSVDRDLILDVIDEILKVDGISEVHSVAGEYDLAAIARVEDNQQLSMILADKMCHQIKGIKLTKTLISLGSYYNFDPKAVFVKKNAPAKKAAKAKKK